MDTPHHHWPACLCSWWSPPQPWQWWGTSWGITMPSLASRDPDLSGQTAHRQFSRKAIIRLLTRKGINLQSKIPDKDLKALSSDTLSSLAGCAQDCLHLLVNLFCGKDHRRKQAFLERLCWISFSRLTSSDRNDIASATTVSEFGPVNYSGAAAQ